MGDDWKENLAKPLVAVSAFRFKEPFISASSIAQQYYCEAKVEQEFIHGDLPTEVKELGSDLHDEVFAMEPVELEDLIHKIETAPRLTTTFGLHGRLGALDVVGTPDAVVFEGGVPRYIIELKTTKGDPSRLWKEQETQVRIYGALMEAMGFDCTGLELVLVRWKQDDLRDSEQKGAALELITDSLFEKSTSSLEKQLGMKFFLFPHSVSALRDDISWASGYWMQTRELEATDNPNKCRACEYNQMCQYSLAR
jgi:PD-(D/E)XK nuclease superfamily